MELGLKNKVMMVAASSKGLGFGVAQALAKDGARLSMCSREADPLQAAADQLRRDTSAEIISMPCDVRDLRAIEQWVATTVEQWGQVDGLLVNAGGPPAALFKELTDEQWQAAFELTLLSTVRMIRAVIPHMKQGGAILTITSSSVREPVELLTLSTVMRSGVVGLVKTLADELAGDGIRVNNLMPGRIATERVALLDANTAKKNNISVDDARQRSINKIPLGRYGKIEEFGAAGAFLLSSAASYITGASLRVDGGMMRSI